MRAFCSTIIFCLIALLSEGQGSLIGVTSNGGTDDLGVIFKTDVDGRNQKVLYEFRTPYPGRNPFGNIVEVSPGVFYGITYGGGPSDRGVIFSYTPQANTFVKLAELKDLNLAGTVSSLIKGPDNKLYFSSSQGVYSYDPITNRAQYVFSAGGWTNADPFFGSDGLLYITATRYDYSSGVSTGFLYSYNLLTYQFNEIDFDSSLGYPTGTVMEASNGKIYGITYQGGSGSDGAIFEFNPTTASLASVATFSNSTSFQSRSSMVEAPNGKLYGVLASGGSTNSGAIFEFDPVSNTWSDIHDFMNDQDGGSPMGGLVIGPNGNLWGTTFSGGDYLSWGTIYEFNYTNQTLQTRFSFDGTNGGGSTQALLLAGDQKFYSITANSGLGKVGTFFTFDPGLNQHTKLFDFNYSPFGANPYANMIQTKSGKFYGTTSFGGSTNDGVVYTFDIQSSHLSVLHHFNFADGSWPAGGLMEAQNGKLYGTTINGGANYGGVIYEIDPTTDSFVKKSEFDWNQAGIPNGAFPWGRLTEMQNKLYGLTSHGGTNQLGVIYEYDYTTEVLQPKFSFDGTTSGSRPYGHLLDGGNGNLYGLTSQGGSGNSGTLFKFDPSSSNFAVFESFTGDNGGAPFGSLTNGSDGLLYGMTETGGASNYGVLFTLNPATDTFAKRLDFPIFSASTFQSNGSLTQSANGKFYGLGFQGGDSGNGFVFEYDPFENGFVKTVDFNGLNASHPDYSSLLFAPGFKQDIDFTVIPSKQFGDPSFQITAIATSGLPVTFLTGDPAVATISGSTVTIVGAGSVVITASQSGNSYYAAAPPAQQTLTVNKASQTITFNSLSSVTFGDAPFDLVATSSSGLPVTFTASDPSLATVSGSKATIVGEGHVTITAFQEGDNNYLDAAPISHTFCINPPAPVITVTNAISSSPLLTSSNTMGNEWFLNGASIASDDHQLVAKTDGTYTVMTTIDGCGSELSSSVIITVTADNPFPGYVLNLYPNPVDDKVIIAINGDESSKFSIEAFDISGKEVFQSTGFSNTPVEIDARALAGGVYILKLKSSDFIFTRKLVKN